MSRAFVLATLVAFAANGSLHAQSVGEWQRHFEQLTRTTAQMTAAGLQAERERLRSLPVDTVRAGALVVFTPRSRTAQTRAIADSAWRVLDRLFGERANALSKISLLVSYPDQVEGDIPAGPLQATLAELPSGNDLGSTVNRLVAWVQPAITQTVDQPLREWGLTLPLLGAAPPSAAYEELAISPWSSVRSCYQGRIASCRLALGISGENPLFDWFDATDRRHYASRMTRPFAPARLLETCQGGDDQACIDLLRSPLVSEIVPPLSAHARQLLLQLAIETGGPGAFERLTASAGTTLDQRLTATARVPIDSLVSQWRGQILAAHPKTVAADERAAWAAVGWGVLLGAVALRSTKWR